MDGSLDGQPGPRLPAAVRAGPGHRFKADTGRSCLDYYNELNARSCRIRDFLVDGNAAAVEVREVGLTPKWGT